MGWSISFDTNWQRDVGYAVPAYCDHPECNAEIDRGLAYVCCGEQPYGGERGCGLYFCSKHQDWEGKCSRCRNRKPPFNPKPDHPQWIHWKLTDESWAAWRKQNLKWVRSHQQFLAWSPTPSADPPAAEKGTPS